MSGECDKCGEHCVDCKCKLTYNPEPLCRGQQNGQEDIQECPLSRFKKINPKIVPLEDMGGIDPPADYIKRKLIDVKGREEHEALIKNASKCKELGLDQVYEAIVYLNRWGSWLNEPA